mmetsp:Transcript_24155/g.61401  ORF Transcript_24155/g.61401 Transcript_24155/m.61401 type:complete len:262 (+) Transcript_24155:646-1431(+)
MNKKRGKMCNAVIRLHVVSINPWYQTITTMYPHDKIDVPSGASSPLDQKYWVCNSSNVDNTAWPNVSGIRITTMLYKHKYPQEKRRFLLRSTKNNASKGVNTITVNPINPANGSNLCNTDNVESAMDTRRPQNDASFVAAASTPLVLVGCFESWRCEGFDPRACNMRDEFPGTTSPVTFSALPSPPAIISAPSPAASDTLSTHGLSVVFSPKSDTGASVKFNHGTVSEVGTWGSTGTPSTSSPLAPGSGVPSPAPRAEALT